MYKKYIIFSITLYLLTIPMTTSAKNANDYLNTGIKYLQNDNLNEAESNFKKAILLNPKNIVAYNKLGEIYLKNRDYSSAEKSYLKALSLQKDDEITKYNILNLYEIMANEYVEEGSYNKAILYYNKLLKERPESSKYNNKMGICYLKINNLTNASLYVKKALKLNPSNDLAYYTMGEVYLEEVKNIKKPESNIDIVKEKLNLANNFFKEACFSSGDSEMCISSEKINSIKKKLNIPIINEQELEQLSQSHVEKAYEFIEKQDYSSALLNLRKALEVNNINQQAKNTLIGVLNVQGNELLKKGNKTDGLTLINEAKTIIKREKSAWFTYTIAEYLEKGDIKKAIQLIKDTRKEQIIKYKRKDLSKEDINEMLVLGYIMNASSKFAEESYLSSYKSFKKAQEIVNVSKNNSYDNRTKKTIKDGIENSLLQEGLRLNDISNFKEAEKFLTELNKLKPNNSLVNSSLGYSKMYLGKYNEAIKLLNQSISLDPSEPLSYYNLSCAYSLNKNKVLALKNLTKAISLNPKFKESAKNDKDFNYIKDELEFINLIN